MGALVANEINTFRFREACNRYPQTQSCRERLQQSHSSLCLAFFCMLRIDNNCAMHRAHSWTNDCWANQLIFVLHFDAPCVQCRVVRLQTSWRRSTTQYRAGTVRKLSCCPNTAAWGTMSPNSPAESLGRKMMAEHRSL